VSASRCDSRDRANHSNRTDRGDRQWQRLLGISKRGNCYLRKLVQGARAVLQFKEKQSSGLSAWLTQLTSRTHYNVAGVALANKLARIAWAVLATGETYRPPMLASGSV
jgi:transposase